MAKRMKQAIEPKIAFSYVRFSTAEQAKGDSLRRQTELRDAWLKRSGAILDTTLTLRDEGVSGFTGGHRENPDRHALATFLDLVKSGRIRRGNYLVIESLDWLSREHIRPALTLLLNLIESGIRVVQLLPTEAVYDESVEPMQLMMAIMELSRGHSESRMKAERMGAAWRTKKLRAAETGEPITAKVPAWLAVMDGRFAVQKDKAEVVRRVYKLAVAGHGIGQITRRLNVEGVPAIGRGDTWNKSYVASLLSTRATVGEYQPTTVRGRVRKPDGGPILNYFPAIVTDDEWHAARSAVSGRRQRGGRIGRHVNLFAGILKDARDGGTLHRYDPGVNTGIPRLVNYQARQGVGDGRPVTFPLEAFEKAILSKLKEVDPRDILPGSDRSADRVMGLAGKLGVIEGKIEKLKAALVEGDEVAPLIDVMKRLEANRQAVAAELATARQAAASPVSEAWGDCKSLLDTLVTAPDPDDARTRLRSALRRVVTEIRCLFIARKMRRIAAVQIWFTGGAHRDYLITYTPPTGSMAGSYPAKWEVRSFAAPGRKGELDLRKRSDAAKLEKVLEAMDVTV